MSHFYGLISGQAGEATRMGSKRSGYHAWAQDSTTQVSTHLSHNDRTEHTEAIISIRASTQNYSGEYIFTAELDLTALWQHREDQQIRNALKRAQGELQKASDRARKLAERGRK